MTPTPIGVPDAPLAKAVASGYSHSCAASAAGKVWCWGALRNSVGTPSAVLIDGFSNAIDVALGYGTCAVLSDSTAMCSGSYPGNGFSASATPTAVLDPAGISPLADVRAITVGINITCALSRAGAAHCWGSGHGAGDPQGAERLLPTLIAGL